MKRWLRIKFKNTVTKFMVSYSLVLLLPLIISMIGYQISFNIVEDGIKDTNLMMINQIKDSIDNEFLALNSMVMQLSVDAKINNLTETRNRNQVGFYSDVKESIKLLSNLSLNTNVNIMERFYIYLRDTDYIITPQALYRADFYHEHMLENKEGTFEEWKASLFDQFNYNKYVIHESEVDNIQSIPFSHKTNPKGAVVMTVKKDKIASFFAGLNEGAETGAFVYIEDENGKIITSLSQNDQIPGYIDFDGITSQEGFFRQKIDGQNMIVIHTFSDVNNWKYILVMPNSVVMKDLISFQRNTIKLFVVAFAIGILIAYYMAYKNSKPLNKIVRELKEFIGEDESSSNDPVAELGGAVSTLITNNQALASEIKQQQPLIKAALLQKLIKGEFTNINEIKVISESTGINMMFDKLMIITFRIFAHNESSMIDINTLQELNIGRIVTKEALKKQIGDQVYFYDVDHLTSVGIIGLDGLTDIQLTLEKMLQSSKEEVFREHGISPFFGISNECTNLLAVWRSYEEAKKALQAALKKENSNIMWYNDVREIAKKYYYPLDYEQMMIKHIKAGESKNIDELLKILYEENFEKRQLEHSTVDRLYNEMISTVIKLTQPDTDPDVIDKLNLFIGKTDLESVKGFFKTINHFFTQTSSEFNKDTTSRHLKTINEIKSYIKENYHNSDLGLSMVATEFNISEGYLSFFFKEQTGVNFTEYVENLRISRACELLKESDLTINKIGESVGYNSAQSFRRAFRRIKDTTPSAIRKG